MKNSCHVGRFAPSPTGPLHFGSLVAALGSYLDARSHSGCWLLRIDDLDTPRVRPGIADEQIRTLARFGFHWDGSPVWQSSNTQKYQLALKQIAAHVYPCRCSRKQVAEAGIQGSEGFIYPGHCRDRRLEERASRDCLRVRVGAEKPQFEDILCGIQSQDIANEVGDFVLQRADGIFSYHLAVVLDDADQGVTRVVRGADLLESTPRQVLLHQLLGLEYPQYMHLPLALDSQGRKLSKQDDALPVDPENPLPALLEAYRFLGQEFPGSQSVTSIDSFWRLAVKNWNPLRIPSTSRGKRSA